MQFLTDQEQSKQASPYAPQVSGCIVLLLYKFSSREKECCPAFSESASKTESSKKKKIFVLFISFEIKAHKEISLVKVKTHKTRSSAVEVLTTDFYGS